MTIIRITSPVVFALILCAGAAARAAPPPAPVFPAASTADTLQGVKVPDPYRALENAQDPAVKAWSDAQNQRSRAYLDALPYRQAVAAKLAGLTRAASPSWNNLVARGPYIFAIHIDPARQQPTLVTLAANADPATQHMLLDPNALDTGGHTAIDWFVPSQDGSKVAVSLSRNGSEDGTLHVYEVASGKEIDAPIPRVQYPTADGALAWSVDGTGFWYTRYPGDEAPESERHVNQTLWFHVLGQPEATDTQILSARDGIPRTGEIMLDNRAGGSAVLASVQLGDGGQWQQFVLKVGEKPVRIADYGDRIVAGAIAQDGTVYGLSRLDAPTGKVLKLAPPYTGGFAHAATIIARRNESAIIDGSEWTRPLTVTGSRLFVTRIAGGPNSVSVHGLDGRALGDLPLPPISSVRNLVPLANGRMLYNVASYTRPPHYENWNPATGKSRPTSLAQTSPVNYDDVTVTRIFATSKDGTRVPLNIIAPKGIPLDGSHPTLLYGYGGYGLSLTPTFLGANWRLWLDSGGVLVMANIRGGGEYGDSWHRQGMLTHRQAVFDDFAAAGEALIAHGYTSHARLALEGASNGGLLMGVTLTQHPGLARAVVSAVGIYDMIRYELDPNGAFNVAEYGTVKDPEQFRALYAYSPYHHVVAGTDYPAVLMVTGANDGRVNPLQSRKFTAALQAAQGNADHPILLRTSQSSGHGIGSSLDDTIALKTDELIFLFDQLGMDGAAAAP